MRFPETLNPDINGGDDDGDSNMEEFVGRMGWTKERASDFFSSLPLPPILIAVMGKKCSGKTSFINAVTGASAPNPYPSTLDIRFVATELCGRSVTFIDTPGCDDDMSGVISQCLEAATSKGMKMSGTIYLHRITDSQMDASHAMNTRKLFSKLCGDGDDFGNVILCTTMWEKVARGTRREKQLCGDSTFWGDMIKEGALVERHQGPDLAASARRVAEILVNKRLIAMQNQVLLENKTFFETAAGKMWIREREEIGGKHEREVQQLKAELRDAVAAKDAKDEEFALVVEEKEQMKEKQARELQQLKTELQDAVAVREAKDGEIALVVEEREEMKEKHIRELQQLKAELQDAVTARDAKDEEFTLVMEKVGEQMGQLRDKLQDANGLLKAQPLMMLMWRIIMAQKNVVDACHLAAEVSYVLTSRKSEEEISKEE